MEKKYYTIWQISIMISDNNYNYYVSILYAKLLPLFNHPYRHWFYTTMVIIYFICDTVWMNCNIKQRVGVLKLISNALFRLQTQQEPVVHRRKSEYFRESYSSCYCERHFPPRKTSLSASDKASSTPLPSSDYLRRLLWWVGCFVYILEEGVANDWIFVRSKVNETGDNAKSSNHETYRATKVNS